jgi:hypothetical protein
MTPRESTHLKNMKVTTSDYILNIIQNINPFYGMLQSVQDQTMTSLDNC